MDLLTLTLALLVLLTPAWGFDMGQSTRCVPIPHQMSVCQDVGYSEMRLPNFLGHSSLESEVVPRSEDWRPLLQTGCHPHAQAFLCSLIAPVCLDTFFQPCRSLCVAVRDSCAPVLACQGHVWPEALDCDRFPAQEDMCLTPHPKHSNSHLAKALPQPACQACPSVEEHPTLKTVLDALCQDDFAVTAKLSRRRRPSGEPEFEVEGRVEFIRQGPLLPYDTQHLLQQWLLINLRCANALVRPGRAQLYLLTGAVQPEGTLALTRLFPWHKKDHGIAVATRKWKHHKC
ncbi:secreted frizzled-related protein 5-like [Salvelinus namaycush]|uniref:Secreted frizzled-related protein 5-like n=1 Tax=Salvelinus namaycush TaxID=8040 RepID=A0A8U1H8H5_SALNM|nr:secreted frizzled-related protein 5-like [Salvelinus namaycush]